MNDVTDIEELQSVSEIGIFEGIMDFLFLEGIGLLFTLAALVLIIVSSIKLISKSKAPGSKLIFSSVILTIIGTILSILMDYYFIEESSYIYTALINIYLAVVFFIGSLGFLRVCNHVIKVSANK